MQPPAFRQIVPNVLSLNARRSLLVCFSHLRWNFVFQRPQHLMTRAARKQPVLFFEEPIVESAARAHVRVTHPNPGVTVATPILPEGMTSREASLIQRSLLDELLVSQGVRPDQQKERLVTWYFTPMALDFSRHLNPGLSVYDCMDELSQFRGAPADIRDRERQLIASVGLMFTGGASLYEAKRALHPHVHAFPSSIDAAHFGKARRPCRTPPDQAAIPGKRIGFFGVIDERFNAELLGDLAGLRPDWRFVMVGPTAKIDRASLPNGANIHWLGQKSYAELPDYLAGWDVGIMPFALNEATRFISPTKTPEFLAAGLPVVSTAVPDVVRNYGSRRLVEIGRDAADFAAKIEAKMVEPRAEWLRRVDAFLETTSWDRTWSGMEQLMAQHHSRSVKAVNARVAAAGKSAVHV